jgi:dinuclear metal center YbgI/SA1388 family protein
MCPVVPVPGPPIRALLSSCGKGDAVSVRLGDVIEVLDDAYPPGLAQDWDSVGLVCGDPSEHVESVTVAVDATAEVAAEVGDRGLLLAHHPLLLRGVDTVAADTAKGALLHGLIRRGSALFTAHTNADAASPGVSDALASTLGLNIERVLAPAAEPSRLDKWVIFVPEENTAKVRAAIFAAGAGQMGHYSHCSWTVSGIGQFLPHAGASPTIGSVGSVEQVAEERIEAIAPASARAAVLAAMRAAHPYEEPAFDVFTLAPLPTDTGIGRICSLPEPEPLSAFVARVAAALPATSWGVRAAGDPDGLVSRVAVCGGAGDSLLDVVATAGVQAYLTADLRHHPADEHRRRSGVALVDVAHWASEYPWCAQAAAVLAGHFGDALPVRVSSVRTDPWNVEREV